MTNPIFFCSWDGCFLVFLLTLNKSKNLVVILLTLNKSKNSRGRNRMLMHFLFRPSFFFFFCFLNAQASSFLIHSHVTYRMSCHARGHSRSSLMVFFPPNPVIPHSPMDYRQVFRPILYFQPSPAQRRVIRDFTPPPFLP